MKPVLLQLGLLTMVATSGCGFTGSGEIGSYDGNQPNSSGDQICKAFSQRMQGTSSNWAAVAWGAGALGTIVSVLGGFAGSGKDTDRLIRRASGVLLASLGSVLAATSAYSVSRSSAASDAAAEATRARAQSQDYQRFNACLDARAHWLQSRAASLDHMPPSGSDKSHTDQGEKTKTAP